MIYFCDGGKYFAVYMIFLFLLVTVLGEYSPIFDENVAFQLKWPGKPLENSDIGNKDLYEDVLSITTLDKENYSCVLHKSSHDSHSGKAEVNGPSPLNLLKPIFSEVKCSLRIEQFWTYELCHGRFIRQYHKEIVPHGNIYQEYILGKYDPSTLKDYDKFSTSEQMKSNVFNKINVDGTELPYWSVNMTDGSFCELNGVHRFTHVMYVCSEDGKHEIYSINEASTCEYEVIVLSPLLCAHPAFRKKFQPTRNIFCYALGNSPTKPHQVLEEKLIEVESDVSNMQGEAKVFSKESKGINQQVKPRDHKLINDLLHGDHCLRGGTGWWKYEFCYGKKALQYHEETNGVKTTILLGTWNMDNHLLWIAKNPHKRPKKGQSIKQISHMYTEGSFCDETGKHRQVEVRLKCQETNGHPNSISLYLLEPRPCEYILPVESPILCPLIESANEDGLT